MDDYVIGDEVEDRVINNHQCEILMPHKVKVALQDLRSIYSLSSVSGPQSITSGKYYTSQ